MAEFTVREACESDCDEILRLIVELAEFEKMTDQVEMTVQTLKEDGFGKEKLFHCLVAENNVHSESCERGKLLGYLLYYWSYSTWTGRMMYVEDLYVTQEHRRRGMASAMWKRAIEIAKTMGCQRMQWSVLEWNNPAIGFYKKMGAMDMYEKEGWRGFRLAKDALDLAAASLS